MAKSESEKLAVVSVVTTASISQPTTSLMAAALMAITAREVRVMPSSIMMRPSTGSAVIENAVATNRADATGAAAGDTTGAT